MCQACREGRCEDCLLMGLRCSCCDRSADLAEHAAELEFASLHEEGLL